MRVQVFSDLHVEFPRSWFPTLAQGADAVLCAGDVCQGLELAIELLRSRIPAPTPIITVAGNHSFYGRCMDDEWQAGRQAAHELGVTLLENESAVIGNVRFIGATLWTDYALYGDREAAMNRAARELNDHRVILHKKGERFTPEDSLHLHTLSIGSLSRLLSETFDGPTVVVTHHAPSPRSIDLKYQGNGLNPAFCSDLEPLILKHQPAVWVHGHMHNSADYRIGRTRVLNNPHGYGRENRTGFDPDLVAPLGENAS